MKTTENILYISQSANGEGLGSLDATVLTEEDLQEVLRMGLPLPEGFQACAGALYDPSAPRVAAGEVNFEPEPTESKGYRFFSFVSHPIGKRDPSTPIITILLGPNGRYERVISYSDKTQNQVGTYSEDDGKIALGAVSDEEPTTIIEEAKKVMRVMHYLSSGDTDAF